MQIIIAGTHNTRGNMNVSTARDSKEARRKMDRLMNSGEFKQVWMIRSTRYEVNRRGKQNIYIH